MWCRAFFLAKYDTMAPVKLLLQRQLLAGVARTHVIDFRFSIVAKIVMTAPKKNKRINERTLLSPFRQQHPFRRSPSSTTERHRDT
jgi:hypothetical protein